MIDLLAFAEQIPDIATADAITGIGGTGVAVYVAIQFGRIANAVTKFLGKLEDELEDVGKHREEEVKAWRRAADHYDVEERHQRRVEELFVPARARARGN